MARPREVTAGEQRLRLAAIADHRVEFYDDDSALTEAVAAYLRPVVPQGVPQSDRPGPGCAVMVASPAHQRDFLRRLGPLAAGERLLAVDADATLAQLMRGGSPDPYAFDEVIGGLVRRAQRVGGPVRVYGEMVATLWERGLVEAAMRLEALWDRLGAGRHFGLMCGYPSVLFAASGSRPTFEGICRQHHAVTTPAGQHLPRWASGAAPEHHAHGVRWRLPAALSSGGLARRHLQDLLRAWDLPEVRDVAELLVTELVTNAVLHAGSPVGVHVTHQHRVLRVEVDDVIPGRPQRADPCVHDTRGRGVMLVEALSTAWGTSMDAAGKTVWFELGTRRAG